MLPMAHGYRTGSTDYLLLFHRYYVCSVLYSFPTRRSSDLREDSQRRCHPDSLRRHRVPGRARVGTDCIAAIQSVPTRARPGTDRKSTRLNSSHTVISYAVFCLKKKKADIL